MLDNQVSNQMFYFFKMKRLQLISNHKFFKYATYAIGEIAIVIIGIIVALQINNWNEYKKERILENEIVSDLLIDLKKDLTYMQQSAERVNWAMNCSRSVAYALENDAPMTDSLRSKFYGVVLPFSRVSNESTYENLKTIGFGIISNKKIRQGAQDLYSFYKAYDKSLDFYNTEFMMTINKQQAEHLLVNEGNYPKDYESLKENFVFINTVNDIANIDGYQLGDIDEVILKLNNLIAEIEMELSLK